MTSRWREVGLVAVIAGLCSAGIVLASRSSYFFADDWSNLAQARQHGMSWSYLQLSYAGHFAPVHRVLDWLWSVKFPLNWGAYLAFMVVVHMTAVAAIYALLRALRCGVLLAAITTTMFASSAVWVRLFQYPASGELVACGLAAAVVSVAACMTWFRSRSPWLLALAAAAMIAGLLSYEKAALIVLYVVLLRYFVLAPSLRPRALVAQARADWLLLVTLFGLLALYALVLLAGDYGTRTERPSAGQLLEFLGRNWLRGTGSLVINQAQIDIVHAIPTALVIAAQVVLAAALIISVLRRRDAWRAWAFLLVCWLPNAGVVGLARVVRFGTAIGIDARYNAEMAFLVPLTLALAFRAGSHDGSVGGAPAPASHRRPLPVTVLPVALGAALLAASCFNSYGRIERSYYGDQSLAWVRQVRSTATALSGPYGRVSVIDAVAPFYVVSINDPPYDRLSAVLPLVLDGRVDFDGGSATPAIVEPDGSLRPARFTPLWVGRFAGKECGPKVLRRTVDNGKEERLGLVRVLVEAPARATQIDVGADYGNGMIVPLRPIRVSAGDEAGGVAAEMKGLRALELRLPAGVCVGSLVTVLAS